MYVRVRRLAEHLHLRLQNHFLITSTVFLPFRHYLSPMPLPVAECTCDGFFQLGTGMFLDTCVGPSGDPCDCSFVHPEAGPVCMVRTNSS